MKYEGIDDMLDADLCQLLKGRCRDATALLTKANHVVDAEWEPAPHDPTELDQVKVAAISVVPYAALIMVVFWWQQSGRLEMSTGFWAMIALAGMAVASIALGHRKEV